MVRNLIKLISTKYNSIKKMSQIRLFAIVVTIIVVPITIITIFSYNLVINQIRSRYVYTLSTETQQLANMLNAELGSLLSIGRTIISDDNIKTVLDTYLNGSADREETAEALDQFLLDYENTAFLASSLLPKIALITSANELFGDSLSGGVLNRADFLSEIQTLYGTNQNVKWTSDSEIFLLDEFKHSDCLYLILAMRDSHTFKTIATVVLQQRVSALTRRVLPNMYNNQSVIIASSAGRPIVVLDNLDIEDALSQWIDVQSANVYGGDRSIEKTVDGINRVMSEYPITRSNWRLISISSIDNMDELKHNYIQTLLLTVTVCLVSSFLLAFRSSKRFMRPMLELNDHMKLVRDGNFNVRLKPTSDDEIGELTKQFNDMLDHINHLIELNQKKSEEKRVSDIRFLQTQINPHFIYNTLTLLRYTVLSCNKEQADSIILAFNGILRYAFAGSDQFVTLNRALEWVKDYFVIVNCSMEKPVEVIYDLEEGTGDLLVIRMLIQPIVENAVFHGLKKCKTLPRLKITSRTSESDLIITIWDNGPGFDTQESSARKEDFDQKSIGIDNVNQRIRLYYGERYGVSYRSFREGFCEGTEAIIVLPTIKKEDGEVLIHEHIDCR